MSREFKLSAELRGHDQDVRSVTALPQNKIGTGSRDRSVSVWENLNTKPPSYVQARQFFQHQNFVACVAAIPPCADYPEGGIVSGSNDTVIYAWSLSSLIEPVHTMIGHENVVSAVVATPDGTIISGSWDKTIRIWKQGKCVQTLRGHEHSVLGLCALPYGDILSCSSDKTIRLWKGGQCVKTFRGHEDVVRGLCLVEGIGFASCSNDCTIRVWFFDGNCEAVLHGHDSFIYSISVLNDLIISASEDCTVRVWSLESKNCLQIIHHPKPVWSAAFLQNGDFVTGCQDTVARVWTRNPEEVASDETIHLFNETILASASSNSENAQSVDISKLPGKEALLSPGKNDGQHLMIREGQEAFVYQWSESNAEWVKIGQVTGQSAPSKRELEGVEYDYVFDVDLDGGMVLQIGYNNGDNPYEAAQDFIHKHELPQEYLDAIAQHLIRNTNQSSQKYSSYNPDPYTGNRSEYSNPAPYNPPSTTTRQTATTSVVSTPKLKYIPLTKALPYESKTNLEQMKRKIVEFNDSLESNAGTLQFHISINELGCVDRIISAIAVDESNTVINESDLRILNSITDWPAPYLLPVVDLLRLVCLRDDGAAFLNKNGQIIQKILKLKLSPDEAALTTVTLRFYANIFVNQKLYNFAREKHSEILDSVAGFGNASLHRNIREAHATVLMNASLLVLQEKSEDGRILIVSSLGEVLRDENDVQIQRRLLVALGTTVIGDEDAVGYCETVELTSLLRTFKSAEGNEAYLSEVKGVLKLA